jgi:3'(2'),5'-bisphosphate nucleotidase
MHETVAPVSRTHIVIAGHVDDGKSTILGRLLADTDSLPIGKLEQVRDYCQRSSKQFEYAFLVDALKDERAQGITIDAARVFFRASARQYVIIDAPGHVEFLKNMITGASTADAALLVVDAHEGVRATSRRHAVMLSILGVRQLAVLVNKMDLVGYRQEAYDAVVTEMRQVLARLGLEAAAFIPVAGREGANLARRSTEMAWYGGPTVLDMMETFTPKPVATQTPFRMPVQGVYKFTGFDDTRRIIAGTVESGRLRVGDEVVFYPSTIRSRVRSIERFNGAPPESVDAGIATGFTLDPQVYVVRGEIAARADEPPPRTATRVRATLFYLGRRPLDTQREIAVKLGTARVPARIETIEQVIDDSEPTTDFDPAFDSETEITHVDRNQVAQCVLRLLRPIACDLAGDLQATGRFALVDNYEICGGGIIRDTLPDVADARTDASAGWQPERTAAAVAAAAGLGANDEISLEVVAHVVDIARRAGERILAAGARGAACEFKEDGSPLTRADRASHESIAAELSAWAPSIPIASEEAELPSEADRRGWRRYWLVDPLDGTKELLAGRPDFTVNIALIDDGEPVLGVVHAPAHRTVYYAGRGLGTWRQIADQPAERIYARPPDAGAGLRIVESRSHPSAELETFLGRLPVATRTPMGSALKFAWLAEGRADCYPRFGPTMAWDVAAGDCLFRNAAPPGADGSAQLHHSPLSYDPADFRQAPFVLGFAPPPPAVIWLTGLPASGKSTIAAELFTRLRATGARVELLDGDEVRRLFPSAGFTREARDAHVRHVGHLASRLEHHGVIVIVSLVSPYREARDFVRSLCRRFVEVHVSTPLDVCERRDPKGLYARARAGALHQMTGVDDPYEPPLAPEVVVDTNRTTLGDAVDLVIARTNQGEHGTPRSA